MSKIKKSIADINSMDEIASSDSPIHALYPLTKLIVTIIYIWMVISFPKYNIFGVLCMSVYVIAIFILSEVSFKESLKKLRVILPICCIIGLFNPLFDHLPLININGFIITGGVVSMITLIIKEALAVFASYLFMATTGINKICYSLSAIHVPGILVTQILLTYRYITVLLKEAGSIYEAYSLRAPGQKGIHFRVWGTMLGQLIFRSIDRARLIYENMVMRGYTGKVSYGISISFKIKDVIYIVLLAGLFVFVRYFIFK